MTIAEQLADLKTRQIDLENAAAKLKKQIADLDESLAKKEPVTFFPGPYRVGEKDPDRCVVRIHAGSWFGMVHVHWQKGNEQSISVAEATARLLEQAPQMFDVFCGCLENDKPPDFSEMVAIIKRVRGQ